MLKQIVKLLVIILVLIQNSTQLDIPDSSVDKDAGKSSLVFVFDTTGSMHNDLRQLKEGAEMILNTALEESNVIEDFVFVPFHDPTVGPATVTKDKQVFKGALDRIWIYGGGDCPEKSLGGIQLALAVSRPRSFLYVFTDATASDHRLVGKVLDAVQRKQSQVVFVLTGHCNDLQKPSYKVYQQIAAASAGQVFNLNKTSVHKVLDFVKTSIKGRTVNLGTAVNPAGYNYSQEIPIDSTLGEVTVSVSGAKPSIRVTNPSGEELTGPPQLITTLDLSEIMVVKVVQPEPGNWTITTGSEEDFSVRVVGQSNLTFNYGFSVEIPSSVQETSYRPLQGAYNHMLISLTRTDSAVSVEYAEILALDGRTLFEIPLKQFQRYGQYLADPFVPPDELFYIAISGRDEHKQELRRIGTTAVQSKPPDVPYLTTVRKIDARPHERIVLKCKIESLVPVTAMWTKESARNQGNISSLQSTSIEFVIGDMSEENVGLYQCIARNVAGLSKANTEVTLLVDAPEVSIQPENITIQIGDKFTILCTAVSEALLFTYKLTFNGTRDQYETEINLEPNIDGFYTYNMTIGSVSERDSGIYSCIASNRGGETSKSTFVTIQTQPAAQILGPHTITRLTHSDIQLVCRVENAKRVEWVAPNKTVVKERLVEGTDTLHVYTDIFDVKNVTEDGVWSCIAVRDSIRVSDSVEIKLLIKPKVTIEGSKNITVINGLTHELICRIEAKPEPRILWHRETEKFLNNTISKMEGNIYKSVLTLDSTRDAVNGTYFCFGENSEGIDQDSVAVNTRRKIMLLEGFTDKSVQLYSQIDLHCRVDSYPPAEVRWYHNGTRLVTTDNVELSDNDTTVYVHRVEFHNLGMYTCKANNVFEELKVEGILTVYGLEIPVLSKEPLKRITQKGKSTIISCRVIKGNPEPTISWKYRANSSATFGSLPSDVVMSPGGLEVIILKVEVDHWGVYRCIADNAVGRDVYDGLLVVQYPPELKDKSKDENTPVEVEAGERVAFSCEAVGIPPPIVIWTKDNDPVRFSKNVYLTDSSDLVIEKTSDRDSGLFTCNATSSLGSLQRNFTLVVYVAPTISPPGIEPEIEALEGQLVELPCAASGVPRPQIQWLQNGAPITEARKYMDQFGLRFVANLTDFGEYSCEARNKYGNTSSSYNIYIWVPPYIDPPLQTSTNVLVGENVTLECNVVGFPVPMVSWELRETLAQNTINLSVNEVGNVYIRNASAINEGLYTCIAENTAGYAKDSTFLSVNEPPTILEDGYTGTYIATNKDTALAISCQASGKPTPFVIWSKDNIFLEKDSRYNVDVDGTLTIKAPSEELSGIYTCIAKNVVGQVNRSVPVEIYSLPSRVLAEETETTVNFLEGSNASIECPILTSPADNVKWYKEAKLLSQGSLLILNISRFNASLYACVVTNAVGSAYSTVRVNVEWPPDFVRWPSTSGSERLSRMVQDPEHMEVVRGDDLYFYCGVDSKPAAKTKWLFNSRPLLGEDTDRLKLMNVQTKHSGAYICVVNNAHGTVTRRFLLDVLEPPFISEFDLVDVQLKEGMNATLECYARGSPMPDVQWTYNNTNWHVNNSTLAATNITSLSEGLYRCDATNKAGAAHIVYRVTVAVPSHIAEVVVYKETEVTGETVLDGVELTLGSHARLACIAAGVPAPSIQWIRHGTPLGVNGIDINYADLILDNVQTEHGGIYVCIASNEGGLDERRVKLEVLEPPRIFQNLFQINSSSSTTLEVISGQSFYLHCHPYGNPLPEIYWFRDGAPLRLFDESMVSKEFGETIVVDDARRDQSGNYTCVARNKAGDANVVYLVDVLVPPPTPKESVKPVTGRIGRPLSVTCPVEGSPAPAVMWVRHPYTVLGGTPRIQLLNDNATLLINNTEVLDSGKYSCIMTNKIGTTEVVFDVLILKEPSIAGNVRNNIAESHAVPFRRSIVLKCQADGNPPPNISWLKDTQQLSSSLSNIQRVLGNSLLAIWSASTRDAGQYICVAENTAGTAHRRYNVAVKVPGKWSGWGRWSYCNVTCGVGYQQRARLCQYVDDNNVTYDRNTKSDKIILDDSACKGPTNDKRKCNMPSCEEDSTPRWGPWSKWTPCSASCGAGTQARTRRCRTSPQCHGDNVQIRRCPNLPECSNQISSENEISLNSREKGLETSAYIPEAVFELQPKVINPNYSSDVEEIYIKTEPKYKSMFYDAKVTENLDRSVRGSCGPGYKYNSSTGACDDIDECLIDKNQCHLTQVCVNTAGGYKCGCSTGFVSLGIGQRCLDINECEQDIHGCEYACVNVAGGHVCACPRPLRLRADRRTCVAPSSYRKPLSYEEIESEDYLSTTMDFPTRYTKNNRN